MGGLKSQGRLYYSRSCLERQPLLLQRTNCIFNMFNMFKAGGLCRVTASKVQPKTMKTEVKYMLSSSRFFLEKLVVLQER